MVRYYFTNSDAVLYGLVILRPSLYARVKSAPNSIEVLQVLTELPLEVNTLSACKTYMHSSFLNMFDSSTHLVFLLEPISSHLCQQKLRPVTPHIQDAIWLIIQIAKTFALADFPYRLNGK